MSLGLSLLASIHAQFLLFKYFVNFVLCYQCKTFIYASYINKQVGV